MVLRKGGNSPKRKVKGGGGGRLRSGTDEVIFKDVGAEWSSVDSGWST